MPSIVENGSLIVFTTFDEWGNRKINGLLENGQIVITGITSVSVTDSGSGADTPSVQGQIAPTDAGSGVDGPQLTASMTLTDSASGADFVAISASFSITDLGTGLDAPTIQGQPSISDTATGVEFWTIEAQPTIADVGTGVDSISSVSASFTISETGTGSEWIDVQQGGDIKAYDSGTGAEVVSLEASLTVTDSASGTDVLLSITIPMTDSGSAVDVPAISVSFTVTDVSLWAVESVDIQTQVSNADSGSGLDSVTTISVSFTVSDLGAGLEAVAMTGSFTITDASLSSVDVWQLQAQVTGTDSGTGVDSVASISVSLTITDAGSSSELIWLGLILSDAGFGVDNVTSISASFTITDTGSGTDVRSIQAQITPTDSGSGVDSWAMSASCTVTDSASGVDVIVNIGINITDSASGVDSTSAQASMTWSDNNLSVTETWTVSGEYKFAADSGLGTEVATLGYTFTIAESGAGTEVAKAWRPIDVTDTGAGSDVWPAIITWLFDVGSGVDVLSVSYSISATEFFTVVEVAWRLKGTVSIDGVALPHVIAVDVSDNAETAEKPSMIDSIFLPRHDVVGKRGRDVNIEGWTDSQSDVEALRALKDGQRHVFLNQDGSGFAVIVPVVNVSRDTERYNRRRYRLTLMETS